MNGDLPELLDARLGRGAQTVEEYDEVIDFGDLAGPANTGERTAFAELLAGTADKKSKAYKAARRNVERWVKGRKPIVVSRRRIIGARRQASEELARFRLHGANMRVLVSWYGDRKPEWLPPHRWVSIRQSAMRQTIREWAEGDHEQAAETLFEEFLIRYEVPNVGDWLADVEVIGLRLEPRA